MKENQKAKHRISQLGDANLQRKLGILDLLAVGYGDLGSSIYYALGITAFFALGATPLAMMLGGLVFACTSITYAEMTSSIATSGGSASFAREVFNDLVSFIAGWGLLLDYIVTIAISIFSIAPYLSFLGDQLTETWVHIFFSLGLILLLFLINFWGVKHSTRISIFLTGMTLLTQLTIVVVGFFSLGNFSEVFSHMRIGVANASWSPTISEFWKGTAMAMVAYTGIESIAQLSSETKRPLETLPRAVLTVMGILLTMYLSVSLVGLSAMTPYELGHTYVNKPLAGIVAQLPVGGTWLQQWVGVLAACLLFVAGNAGLLGASRLAFNMGEHYQIPRFFRTTHHHFKTPYLSLAIFSIFAGSIVVLSRGQLHFLADLYNFGAMLAFFFAHLSLIVLRIRKPDLHRPFRSPLNLSIKGYSIPLTAIIGLLSTFSVWLLVVITKPEGRILGFLWMGLGLVMYYIYRYRKKIAPTAQVEVKNIFLPDFQKVSFERVMVLVSSSYQGNEVQTACEIVKQHKASLVAVHCMIVPYSLPLYGLFPHRETFVAQTLQKVEAIGREFQVELTVKSIRGRDLSYALIEFIKTEEIDCLVVGVASFSHQNLTGMPHLLNTIRNKTGCEVLLTFSSQH